MRDIEQAVLKKCLYSTEHLSRVVRMGSIFYFAEHIELFKILSRLYSENRKVDGILLTDIIIQEKPQYLSNAYIAEMNSAVRDDLFDEYVNKIMEGYIQRALEQTFNESKHMNPKEVLFHLTEKLMNIDKPTTVITNKEWCKQQLKDFIEPPTGEFVKCGISFYDQTCGGFGNGDLIVIASRPGGGKTHKMTNIMEYTSRYVSIGCFSMEESASMVYKKMACSACGIDTIKMRQNKVTKVEEAKLTDYLARLYERTVIIDEEPELFAEELLVKALRMKNQHDIKILFVDYLQYAESMDTDVEYIAIKNITKALKTIAKVLDIPVVALAQANRNLDGDSVAPKMKDIYGGSYIEKTASVIEFLTVEQYNAQAASNFEYRMVSHVVKHRNGPTGQYVRYWKKNHAVIKEF